MTMDVSLSGNGDGDDVETILSTACHIQSVMHTENVSIKYLCQQMSTAVVFALI